MIYSVKNENYWEFLTFSSQKALANKYYDEFHYEETYEVD